MQLKFIPLEVKFLKIPNVDFDGHDENYARYS